MYNGVLLQKRISDSSKPDGEDISNLYQNNGYLFSNINPVEVRTANDTIDMEIRITEGPLAYFNRISVKGNDKTNDRVIYRELRTKPGDVYSKETLIRTIREIGQLGFFDAEAIKPEFENVDPAAGTVDIKYSLVEKGASQIELQGGYGGGGFIGTLGLSFNNFSIKNIFKKKHTDHYQWVTDKNYRCVCKEVLISKHTVSLFLSHGLEEKNQFNFQLHCRLVSSFQTITKQETLTVLKALILFQRRLV